MPQIENIEVNSGQISCTSFLIEKSIAFAFSFFSLFAEYKSLIIVNSWFNQFKVAVMVVRFLCLMFMFDSSEFG